MDKEPHSQPGELASTPLIEPNPLIDIRETTAEPIGFKLFEARYGNNPEMLALNTPLALILLMQATDVTLALGPEHDATLHDEKSQTFTDSLLTAMISEKRHAGYSIVISSFANYAGFGSEEQLCEHLSGFVDDKSRYLSGFRHMRFLERLEPVAKLRDTVYLITYAAERMLDATLDGLSMSYEGGDMSIFDQALFREYCNPFYEEPLHDVINVDMGQHGISGQVRKRLAHEAHYLRKTEFAN